MPWKKGAVVIKKLGDEEWADEMEKVLNAKEESDKDIQTLISNLIEENKTLKRDNEFLRKHVVAELKQKIQDAEDAYGYNKEYSGIFGKIMGVIGLILYKTCCFIDKYLKY